jgi:hypothetical protein
MKMLLGPPLLPGCLVGWFEDDGRFDHALVIAIDPQVGATYLDVTVVKAMRVKRMTLWMTERGRMWRVLHGT